MWILVRAPLEGTRPAAMRWTQSSSIPIRSFGFVPIGSGGAFWMYHNPPDEMFLCTHVDDFLLAATSLSLAKRFHAHYSLHHDCKFFIAGTFVGMDIIRDRDARRMYLSQAALIDRLLEQEFEGIMSRENLTGNDLRYNPGQALHKWEQLCPCSTPFDYKMPKLSLVDSPAIPDPVLVHWLQLACKLFLELSCTFSTLVPISHILFTNWLVSFIIQVQLISRHSTISCVIWLAQAIFA